MIAILSKEATDDQVYELAKWFEEQGVKCDISQGEYQTIIGLVGDTSNIDPELVESLEIVESVKRITEPSGKRNIQRLGEFENSGIKTVGVIGLGLIGGSFAKAFKEHSKAIRSFC